jgi:hypothetical protein
MCTHSPGGVCHGEAGDEAFSAALDTAIAVMTQGGELGAA